MFIFQVPLHEDLWPSKVKVDRDSSTTSVNQQDTNQEGKSETSSDLNVCVDSSCNQSNCDDLSNESEDNSLYNRNDVKDETYNSNRVDENEASSKSILDFKSVIVKTKEDIDLALKKGKDLENKLSWERTQAQLLIRQVNKDYENYNVDNFDDLFENDGDEMSSDENSVNSPELSNSSVCVGKGAFLKKSKSETGTISSGESSSIPDFTDKSTRKNLSCDITSKPFQSLDFNVQHSEIEDNYSQISQEAYSRHLKAISEDIHIFLGNYIIYIRYLKISI